MVAGNYTILDDHLKEQKQKMPKPAGISYTAENALSAFLCAADVGTSVIPLAMKTLLFPGGYTILIPHEYL
jgi:hypothetical protein